MSETQKPHDLTILREALSEVDTKLLESVLADRKAEQKLKTPQLGEPADTPEDAQQH